MQLFRLYGALLNALTLEALAFVQFFYFLMRF